MTQDVHYFPTRDQNEKRMSRLDVCVAALFGHLAPDEVDLLAQSYSRTTTTMLEIIELSPKGSLVVDLDEEIEFKPVELPKELMPLLRKHDVFLATIGFDGSRWTVLYMSPPYREGP